MSRGENSDLAGVPMTRLLALARGTKARRARLMEESGRVMAELHRRGLSWRVIAHETGVPQQTARNWARRYAGEESGEDTED